MMFSFELVLNLDASFFWSPYAKHRICIRRNRDRPNLDAPGISTEIVKMQAR